MSKSERFIGGKEFIVFELEWIGWDDWELFIQFWRVKLAQGDPELDEVIVPDVEVLVVVEVDTWLFPQFVVVGHVSTANSFPQLI